MTSKRELNNQRRRMVRTRLRLAEPDVRAELAAALRTDYDNGASIRALAGEHGLAFATIRTLLIEAGATLRSRGGANRVRPAVEQGDQRR